MELCYGNWLKKSHMNIRLIFHVLVTTQVFLGFTESAATEHFITLASTTSTENSGFFQYILPKFKTKHGINVRVVAVGTGQAIRLAKNGDADLLLVHHRRSEEQFVAQGFGLKRFNLMYNDFILVGPKADPAGIKGLKRISKALKMIEKKQARFASRGDDSGTQKIELELWRHAGVNIVGTSGTWYQEMGASMGATLNSASGLDAYTVSDRATWITFANKGAMTIMVENDPMLFNQYGIVLVSQKRHPHIKASKAQIFVNWLLSPEGQRAISSFKVDGHQLFYPNNKMLPIRDAS